MANKQRRILKALMEGELPANLSWKDIRSLLTALGATVTEGKGSRIRVALKGVHWSFHEPHDNKCGKGRANDVKTFLNNAEVSSDDL